MAPPTWSRATKDTLESIRQAAEKLANLGEDRAALTARARRLSDKLGANAFHLAVMGEFKRGKSTLINALVEQPLLPSGVIPLTAIATEVHHGPPGAVVVHLDGRRETVDTEQIADYVTEPKNPNNCLEVAYVEVSTEAPLLAPGVVLVDTPGTASVHEHNTEAALEALKDADGAIVVLSVDSPVSEDEKELLELLEEREIRVFVVVNKVDHLSATETEEARRFIEEQVRDVLGSGTPTFFLAARQALDALLQGSRPGAASGEFPAFRRALESFVRDGLVAARIDSARRELRRLGSELHDAVVLEEAASELGLETLRARVEEFRSAASRERRAQDEDQVLLDHTVARLGERIVDQLASHTEQSPARFARRLDAVAASAAKRRIEDALGEEVERCVREGFEQLRKAQAEDADRAWHEIAADFRARTQGRVDSVRRAAADLFEVHLPELTVPAVAEERERFFYLFVHVEGLGSGLTRLLRLVLPAPLYRYRALVRARHHIAQEFDKHAGRARWDLTQRLDQVRLRFEAAMRAEVEQTEASILAAAENAEALLRAGSADLEQQATMRAELVRLADDIEGVAGLS
jgi:GTP-binding protein EngB required for normal cell division